MRAFIVPTVIFLLDPTSLKTDDMGGIVEEAVHDNYSS